MRLPIPRFFVLLCFCQCTTTYYFKHCSLLHTTLVESENLVLISSSHPQENNRAMDDKNSSLYIDPFKYPSDKDIKNSWDSWKASEKPCQVAAIKWLQCMGIAKVSFWSMLVFKNTRRIIHDMPCRKCHLISSQYFCLCPLCTLHSQYPPGIL